MQLGRPVFFKRLGAPGAEAFAVLFALESFARALLATVLPVEALRFLGDAEGRVRALQLVEVEMVDGRFVPVEGSEHEIPADYVFLAMGFTGVEQGPWLQQFGLAADGRGNISRLDDYSTSADGVYVAGDAGRGQSLIVWAIAEGRACAAAVDEYLTGSTELPAPVAPTDRPLVA